MARAVLLAAQIHRKLCLMEHVRIAYNIQDLKTLGDNVALMIVMIDKNFLKTVNVVIVMPSTEYLKIKNIADLMNVPQHKSLCLTVLARIVDHSQEPQLMEQYADQMIVINCQSYKMMELVSNVQNTLEPVVTKRDAHQLFAQMNKNC